MWLRRLKSSRPWQLNLSLSTFSKAANIQTIATKKKLKATPENTHENTTRCTNWQSCTKKYKKPKIALKCTITHAQNVIQHTMHEEMCTNGFCANQYTVLDAIGYLSGRVTFLKCPFFLSSTFSVSTFASPHRPAHFISYRLCISLDYEN